MTTSRPGLNKKRKKPTVAQVRAKQARGEYITLVDQKVLYKWQAGKTWSAFATYIRHRDALETTGSFEGSICMTCSMRGVTKVYPYKEIQAGHAVTRNNKTALFNDELVFAQCRGCNVSGGEYGLYAIFLVEKFGLEKAKKLLTVKSADTVYELADLESIEADYLRRLESLKKLA